LQNARSLRTEYNAISSDAFSNRSGGIGRSATSRIQLVKHRRRLSQGSIRELLITRSGCGR
jgi:hypothetical protein